MAPAFLLMALTSWYMKSAYNKWSQVRAQSGLTGAQATQRLIANSGLYGVQVQTVAGNLTDHYDPRDKTLYHYGVLLAFLQLHLWQLRS
ncbi:MAG: zinc metallopeptidase [Anaerolineales bacterium]